MKKKVRSKKARVRMKNVLVELNSNYQRSAPDTPKGLSAELQEIVSVILPGALCRFDRKRRCFVVWVGEDRAKSVAFINKAKVRFRGFLITATAMESALPKSLSDDGRKFKYVADRVREAMPASTCQHEENACVLFGLASYDFDGLPSAKGKPVPTLYHVETCLRPPFKLEVRSSTTDDCARISAAKLQFCGTSVKAIYDDKLYQNLSRKSCKHEPEQAE